MAEATRSATERGSTEVLPTEALREAGQKLLTLLLQRATQTATERVEELADRLTGVAENGGTGFKSLLGGGDGASSDGESPDGESRGQGPLSGIKESIKGVFSRLRGGSGGRAKLKVTVISEQQDIGLPLRTTYDLWTRFTDFPSFMKKVEKVDQADDANVNWQAQVWWSRRSWQSQIIEQVPDSHIVWRSTAPKGRPDGGVTFTALGPNLTHVALIIEYYPKGFFEQTANIWRAQGRRARLEFQHFRRHAISHVRVHPEDVEGWRGIIHDGEVVETHEEALQREKEEQERAEPEERAEGREPEPEEREPEEEYAAEDEYEEEEPYEDEEEGAYDDEEGPYDEDEEYAEDEEPVDEEEYEQVPTGAGRRDER
jgi:Polyketide cyclase / dehydrase and lipid transport